MCVYARTRVCLCMVPVHVCACLGVQINIIKSSYVASNPVSPVSVSVSGGSVVSHASRSHPATDSKIIKSDTK